jgi:hypothetical protein
MSVSKSAKLLPAAAGIYLQSLVDLRLLRRTTEAHLLLDTPVISGRAFGTRDRPNILSMLFISCVSLTLNLSFEFCVCLWKKNSIWPPYQFDRLLTFQCKTLLLQRFLLLMASSIDILKGIKGDLQLSVC